jgi:hypothetical protein
MLTLYDYDGPDGPGGAGGNGPPFNFGIWGHATDHEFTMRNDGGGPALAVASGGAMGTGFGWKGGNFPGAGGTCGIVLAAGGTCKLVVTFTPTGSSQLYGQVRVAYNDGGAVRTTVRAVAAAPTSRANVTIAPWFGPNNCTSCGDFDVGTVSVGSSREQVFTLYNTGALAATSMTPAPGLTAPFSYKGTGGYPGTGGDCGVMLPPGGSCQLVIVFAPQAAGTQTRTLAIGYSDTMLPALTATHTITGTGQ